MRIDLTSEELRNLEYFGGVRSGGEFGCSYNLNGEAFKYFENVDLSLLSMMESQLWGMSAVKVDNVALPKDIVYVDDELVGYTRPFFKGCNMASLMRKKENISFTEMLPYLDAISSTLCELANNGIETYDVCLRNCIYDVDANTYSLIDCDFYSMPFDLTKEEIYNNNVKNFLYSIDEDYEEFPCISEDLKNKMKEYIISNNYRVMGEKNGGQK